MNEIFCEIDKILESCRLHKIDYDASRPNPTPNNTFWNWNTIDINTGITMATNRETRMIQMSGELFRVWIEDGYLTFTNSSNCKQAYALADPNCFDKFKQLILWARGASLEKGKNT